MPLIAYTCKCGNIEKKFVRQAKDAPASSICPVCGEESKKSLSAPFSGSKIVIDTPGMARALEISPTAIEDFKERSEKDYSNK